MTTFEKQSDQPLTYYFSIQNDLDATYNLESTTFVSNEIENSARITLNLKKISSTPATFSHSFHQVMNELDKNKNISITVLMENNGQIITHQESGTHIQRPFESKV